MKKRQILQIKNIKIILILIWMIIVFLFSNQQGTDSGNISKTVTIVIQKIFMGNNIDESVYKFDFFETIIRKLAHFSIYTIGGFLLMNYFYDIQNENKKIYLKNKIFYSIFFGALYAVTDELHQFFVPGRSARIFDVGIDTFGVITGVLIYLVIIKLINFIKKCKQKLGGKIK